MGLQARIEAALAESDAWRPVRWTEPALRTLGAREGDPTPVRVRHTGHVVSPWRRATVSVEAILGTADDARWTDGDAVEAVEDALFALLDSVEDCWPGLTPSAVVWAEPLGPLPTRGKDDRSSSRGYVAVQMQCLGPPV